jgi:hypothetical protein
VGTAYTRRLEPADLTDLTGVRVTAHLFQQFIENKAFEVRATVVGERVFAAAIHAGSDAAQIDFRADYASLTYSSIEPPAIVRDGMFAFMRTFGLVFGAFDFAVTTEGEWIISTCAVPAIPTAWLAQAAPGAVILTDVHGQLGGILARLDVDQLGGATGRFVPRWAGFMAMRHTVEQLETFRGWVAEPSFESTTSIDPSTLATPGLFGFVVQWHLPHVTLGVTLIENDQPAVQLVADDGSCAEVAMTRHSTGYRVCQYGPQQLWDQVETAAEFWHSEDRPSYERFGITATPTEQYVWYDHPDSPHRWPLPPPPGENVVTARPARARPTPPSR